MALAETRPPHKKGPTRASAFPYIRCVYVFVGCSEGISGIINLPSVKIESDLVLPDVFV